MKRSMPLKKNKTYELVNYSGKKAIDVRWVYKLNLKSNGEISKHKARSMAKRFLQKERINFNWVYTPVAILKTIRLVLAIATYRGYKMQQFDLKLVFLNGPLEEECYAKQLTSNKRIISIEVIKS